MLEALPTQGARGIYIAYGANMSRKGLTALQALDWVVKRLNSAHISVEQVSSLWRSKAWPNPDDPPFYNAVLRVNTELSADKLLTYLHGLEAETGRERPGDGDYSRNAPRVLDLDLIAYDDVVCEGELHLPHPRAHERGFVMGPLAEIAPDWVHPLAGRTASELFRAVSVARDAYPAEDATDLLR